jgi:SnoaL-like domain
VAIRDSGWVAELGPTTSCSRGNLAPISDIERLLAIEEIKLLKARRDRFVDTKCWDELEELHAPDHHSYNDDYPPWTTAAEMIANVRTIMDGLRTAHHSHTPEITFESSIRASGIWAMTGVTMWDQGGEEHWFVAFGHYFETYERRGDRWVFTSRRLKYLFTKMSPGAIFPPPGLDAP